MVNIKTRTSLKLKIKLGNKNTFLYTGTDVCFWTGYMHFASTTKVAEYQVQALQRSI